MTNRQQVLNLESQAAEARYAFLEAEAQKIMALPAFDAAVTALKDSRELTWVEFDDCPHQWARVDLTDFGDVTDELTREAIEFAFGENSISVDWRNDCITQSIGECIVIDSENRTVIDQSAPRNDGLICRIGPDDDWSDVKKQIAAYMERAGFFPWVIRVGERGDVTAVTID